MGADIIVLEGGDELVDGHSFPSRHGHGPVGVPAAPGASKRVPNGRHEVVGCPITLFDLDRSVPVLLEQAMPRLGMERTSGREIRFGRRVGSLPGLSGGRMDDQGAARGKARGERGEESRALTRCHPVDDPTEHDRAQAGMGDGTQVVGQALVSQVQCAECTDLGEVGPRVHAVCVTPCLLDPPHQPPVATGGV